MRTIVTIIICFFALSFQSVTGQPSLMTGQEGITISSPSWSEEDVLNAAVGQGYLSLDVVHVPSWGPDCYFNKYWSFRLRRALLKADSLQGKNIDEPVILILMDTIKFTAVIVRNGQYYYQSGTLIVQLIPDKHGNDLSFKTKPITFKVKTFRGRMRTINYEETSYLVTSPQELLSTLDDALFQPREQDY